MLKRFTSLSFPVDEKGERGKSRGKGEKASTISQL
jgi:hypothetical protein